MIGLAALAWRSRSLAGLVLICPLAVPIGLIGVAITLFGPAQILVTISADHGLQKAIAFGFLVAAPAAIGFGLHRLR
ncbi:MAG: hypothetical protein WAQ33_02020 [Gaiellaceae bacterium]